MNFLIEKNSSGTWSLTPTAGVYEGRVIAKVEGASLTKVKFAERGIVGAIRALWGVTVLLEDIYGDPETIRSLRLGRAFDSRPSEPVVQEHDCFRDTLTHRALKGAKHLMLMGSNIFGKGLA